MKTIYLSLGSNVGNREQLLQEAIDLLAAPDFHPLRVSSVFETEPIGFGGQPWFLNLALEAETTLFPMQVLARINKVEQQLGRKRLVPKGPRTVDIDILLFGRFVVDTAELTIPHPRMTERRFVLEPMAELAPDLRHPVLRKTMRELLAITRGQAAFKLEFRPVLPAREHAAEPRQ